MDKTKISMENETYKIKYNKHPELIETHGLYGFPYWDCFFPTRVDSVDGLVYKSVKPFSMITIASSGCGKTAMVAYLINEHLQDFYHRIIIMSETTDSRANKHYWSKLDKEKTTLVKDFNDIYLQSVFKAQYYVKEQQGWFENVLIFIDDFNVKSKILNNIYAKGRHANISIIMSLHDVNMISPMIKQNTYYVMYLKTRGKFHQILNHFVYPYIDLVDKDDAKIVKDVTSKVLNNPYTALIIETEKAIFNVFKIPKDKVKFYKTKVTHTKRKQIKNFNFSEYKKVNSLHSSLWRI